MSDRVEYIRRRLDELEAAAKAAADGSGPDWFSGPDAFAVWSRPSAPTPVAVGPYDEDLGEVSEHIALWDPAAVLARVAADRAILALFTPEPGPPETDAQLHARFAHPAYEYEITQGQRKAWDYGDVPPDGDGWERNTDAGRPGQGWDRFDYTEESYWRRRLPDDQIRKPAVHPVIRFLAEGLGWKEDGGE